MAYPTGEGEARQGVCRRELKATLSDEEGVDIMRSLMGDRTLFTNINRPNEGQISFLPKGRIVESNGFISRDSIRPVVSSDPPLGS
jgi:alpha-galactosidase